MKSLSTIVHEANELEALLIESGGLMTPEIESYLLVNEAELSTKIDSYDLIMERFESLAAHYKARADFFSVVAKQCAGVTSTLKKNIKFALLSSGKTEVLGHDVRFALSKSKPAMIIDDESLVPQEYFSAKTETFLDKDKIRQALEVGPVHGVRMEESFALRKYANKKQLTKGNN